MRASAQGLGDQRVGGARAHGARGLGGPGWLRTEGLAGQRAWWPQGSRVAEEVFGGVERGLSTRDWGAGMGGERGPR